MKFHFLFFFFLLWSPFGWGDDLLKDFDSLGGNDVLLEKAKALHPESRVEIIQNRIVKRKNRHELAPLFETVLGGDAYVQTQRVGFMYHWHINPHWSLGARYDYSMNQLSAEGRSLIDQGKKKTDNEEQPFIPDLDWPDQSYMGLISWYPIYGKFSLYNLGVVHFDIYAQAGFGKMKLRYGDSDTYSGGLGMGFWWSQHLTSRLEFRHQRYSSQLKTEDRDVGVTTATLAIGYML